MLYQQPSFTCPAGPKGITQKQWDLSILTRDEFKERYGIDDAEYDRLLRGSNERN